MPRKCYFQLQLPNCSNTAASTRDGDMEVEVFTLFADTERERKDWLRVLWLSGCSFVPSHAYAHLKPDTPLGSLNDEEEANAVSSNIDSGAVIATTNAVVGVGVVETKLTRAQKEARIMNEFVISRVKNRNSLKDAFSRVQLLDNEFLEILGIVDAIEAKIKADKEKELADAKRNASNNASNSGSSPTTLTTTPQNGIVSTNAAGNVVSGGDSGKAGSVEVILQSREETRDERIKADAERKKKKELRRANSDKLSGQLKTLLMSRKNPLGRLFNSYMDVYAVLYSNTVNHFTDIEKKETVQPSNSSTPTNSAVVFTTPNNSVSGNLADSRAVPLPPSRVSPPADTAVEALLKASCDDLRSFHSAMKVIVLSVLGSNLPKSLVRACASTIEASIFESIFPAIFSVYVRFNRFRDAILDERLNTFASITLKSLGLSKELYSKKDVPSAAAPTKSLPNSPITPPPTAPSGPSVSSTPTNPANAANDGAIVSSAITKPALIPGNIAPNSRNDGNVSGRTSPASLPSWDPLESTCRHASLSIL